MLVTSSPCILMTGYVLLQVTNYGDLQYLLAENYNRNVRDLLSTAQDWDWRTHGVNIPEHGVSYCDKMQLQHMSMKSDTCAEVKGIFKQYVPAKFTQPLKTCHPLPC